MQNFTYGSEHPRQSINGSYYDRVIPNYFNEEDVEYSEQKDDYYLFVGRIIFRKGILTAYQTAEALGKKLIIAGQGGKVINGQLVAEDVTIPRGNWEYVGYADREKRKKLMARAKVSFVPTEYLEPFAGTHIEAMLSGTPVLTTDFGVFPQTVINGLNGFRCHTLKDFIDNAKRAETELHPAGIRASAEQYLTQNVVKLYVKWFDDLHNVWESVQDPKVKAWHRV
jgi:glycosyltransferase involved in cell wall biosynthesis